MKTVAIIGAGQRGQDIYASFIKNNSDFLTIYLDLMCRGQNSR